MREGNCELKVTSISKLKSVGYVPLPVYSSCVPAGFPSPADDFIEKNIDLNEWLIHNKLATFIVRVEGDSMVGEIHSGDRLIVDRSLEPRHKDIVVACVDGELTVKRLWVDDNGKRFLVPENPAYATIEINGHKEIIIWGVVTNSIHKTR